MKGRIIVDKALMPRLDQVIEIMTSPSIKGPKRCLACQKLFEVGEVWLRYTSTADPKHGSYSIGIHEECRGVASVKAN